MEVPATPTEQTAGKRNPWIAHVKKTMKAHKGKPFKAILKIASKTMKKTAKKGAKKGGALSPLPLAGGRRKTRRTTRKH